MADAKRDALLAWSIAPSAVRIDFIRSAQEAVKKLRIWTSIANLVVQSPFRFGGQPFRLYRRRR